MPSSSGTPSAATGRAHERPQLGLPRVREIREARPDRVVVGTEQRRPAGQVEVVADHHQRARRVAGLTPPAALVSTIVRAPSRPISSTGSTTSARRVALVQVQPALEAGDRHALEAAQQQAAGVTRCRRRRPAGQVGEGDGGDVRQRVGDAAEAGAEDQAERGTRSDRARTAASSSSRRAAQGDEARLSAHARPRSTTKCPERPPRILSHLDVIAVLKAPGCPSGQEKDRVRAGPPGQRGYPPTLRPLAPNPSTVPRPCGQPVDNSRRVPDARVGAPGLPDSKRPRPRGPGSSELPNEGTRISRPRVRP